MSLGTLETCLLGKMLSGKVILRVVMEIKWIFNAASFLNKLWNTEILWKQT